LETTRVTLAGFLLLLLTATCMALANVLMKNGIAQAGGFAPSFSAPFSLLNCMRVASAGSHGQQ
jgi:hypothetical protein